MIKETVHRFSETDFIRLYCATNYKNGCSPILKHHELEQKLYRFHSLPEFKELFQDICPKKDYINPENSYLDLGNAFQTAQLFGLLTLIQGVGETRSIISCDKNMAQEIISNVDVEMADKMANLFNAIFDLDNNSKEKKDSKISTEDEGNINNQIEDYEKSLESPINKEVKGPILIKSKKKQNNQSCKN